MRIGEATSVPALSAADIARELLPQGQPVRCVAHGSSMRPFIREGDVLTIEPIGRVRARHGDILFYATPDGAAAHRLLGFREERGRRVAVTRGDATGLWTETVEWPKILGVVVAVRRGERRVYRRSSVERAAGLAWAHARGLRMRARAFGSRVKRALAPGG